jgi:hypothetical protein
MWLLKDSKYQMKLKKQSKPYQKLLVDAGVAAKMS